MSSVLRDTIIELIETKREGDYWDFKIEHHRNKADLLHDILCMANTLHDKDCYIILGVEDGTGEVSGIENDTNKRNQQCIIDFLHSKNFAGDNRPQVELRTIQYNDHDIDVIIIFNSLLTPFYLSKDYSDRDRKAQANAIYTRIGDTNTPIRESADYAQVEYLWKKRLGLHLSPFEKLCWLLQDKDKWERNEKVHYNKVYPEFTIRFEDDTDGRYPEFYSYIMSNKRTSYQMMYANYFGTTLYSYQLAVLDSGRYLTTIPKSGYILRKDTSSRLSFRYFIRDTPEFFLHQYLYDEGNQEARAACQQLYKVIPIFQTNDEKEDFLKYVGTYKTDFNLRIESEIELRMARINDEDESARRELAKEMAVGITLVKALQKFRKNPK